MTAKRCIEFLLKLILSLPSLLQSQNLETVPIVNVLYSPHDNIACSHLYSGSMRSNEPSVCLKLWSILWRLVPKCLPTKECQIYLCVPDLDTSRRFVARLLTSLPLRPSVLPWIDYQYMEWWHCTTVALFLVCQFALSFKRISSHDVWYRKTTSKFPREFFLANFCCSSRDPRFKQVPVIFNNIHACLAFKLSTSPVNMTQEWCCFSQNNVFPSCLQRTINVSLLSSHLDSVQRTQTTKTICRFTNKHSQFGTLHHPFSHMIFSNCLPHNSPASGWPYRFLSRGTTGVFHTGPRFSLFVSW